MDQQSFIADGHFDEEYSCRICLEPAERSEVIAPCACKGTSKWVHRACLDHWRSTREDIAFSKCTECLRSYVLTSRADDSCRPKMIRRGKFFILVVRDSSGAFLLTQLVIISLSYLIYLFDSKTSRLLEYFHSVAHARLFYYCCGLIIFLATLGMLYFCVGRANDLRADCTGCCYCHDPMNLDMICMQFCGRGRCHGMPLCLDSSCCTCCTDTSCTCCTDTSCTCCGDVAGTSISSECLPLLFIILILFAIVGAIFVILAGTVFIQKIVRSHIHILQKRGLANDFIVSDLDSDEYKQKTVVNNSYQNKNNTLSSPGDNGNDNNNIINIDNSYYDGNNDYTHNNNNNNNNDNENNDSKNDNNDYNNDNNNIIINIDNSDNDNSNSNDYSHNNNNDRDQYLAISNRNYNQNNFTGTGPKTSSSIRSDLSYQPVSTSSSTSSSFYNNSGLSTIHIDQTSERSVRNSLNVHTFHDMYSGNEVNDIEEGRRFNGDLDLDLNFDEQSSSAALLTSNQKNELRRLGLL